MWIRKLRNLVVALFCLIVPAQAFETKVVQAGNLEFWTESFGDAHNPAILLICGSGNQGLTWHQAFCEKLAAAGYYVIRYDHRDVGLSSTIDYKKSPYSLLDMSKDAIAILDAYNISQAHLVGHSMGGPISMIMAAHFPTRVSSISLFATTIDVRANLDAILVRPTKSKLSPPRKDFLDWVKTYISNPPKTLATRIEKYLEGGRLQNGTKYAYDEELNKELALQSFTRTKNPLSLFNHIHAVDASYDLYTQAASKVKVPTLILHGDQDPILLPDHAQAIQQAIPQARLVMIPGMGHGLNTQLYGVFIENIVAVTKETSAS